MFPRRSWETQRLDPLNLKCTVSTDERRNFPPIFLNIVSMVKGGGDALQSHRQQLHRPPRPLLLPKQSSKAILSTHRPMASIDCPTPRCSTSDPAGNASLKS